MERPRGGCHWVWRVWGLSLLLMGFNSNCTGAKEHACDRSKQLDFRVVGDIEGEWRNESGNTQFSFDADGHIRGDGEPFGCGHGLYPVVEGDYNTFDGGIGNGKVRLIQADLKPGSFALSYKADGGEGKPIKVARGEIVSPGKMHYSFIHSTIHTLHRWRPGDDESTGTTAIGTTMTGISGGTEVSSAGTTSDSEETMTTDTGTETETETETDSGTDDSSL